MAGRSRLPACAVSSLFDSKIEKLELVLGKSQKGEQNIILCSPWDGPSCHDPATGGGGHSIVVHGGFVGAWVMVVVVRGWLVRQSISTHGCN